MEKSVKIADWAFDPLPEFEGGAWRERAAVSLKDDDAIESFVQGPHRSKYFKHGWIPAEAGPKIAEPPVRELPDWVKALDQSPPTIEMVSVEVQTDFRESETQTDPWDPPFIVKPPSSTPELLALRSLTYGRGLPVGCKELEHVERIQEKREWEMNLPPISSDEKSLQKRHKMLMEQKLREMDYTLSEIKEKQKEKAAHRETMVMNRFQDREEKKSELLHDLWEKKKAEVTSKNMKMTSKSIRSLQTIQKKRSILTGTVTPLDEALDFEDTKSVTKHSLTSKFQPRLPESTAEGHVTLSSAKGLVGLEKWLLEEQKLVMKPEIYLPKPDPPPSRLQKIIVEAEKDMLENKVKQSSKTKMKRTFRPDRLKRPTTPTIHSIPQDVLRHTSAALVLQKTLRWHAMQKEIQDICDRYGDLINKLHETRAVTEEGQVALDERKKEKYQHYLSKKKANDEKRKKDEVFAYFEGSVINSELMLLGNAPHRYQEMKKVEALIENAKDQRRRREAEEAGHRQKEILKQKMMSDNDGSLIVDSNENDLDVLV